jgi:integrase
MLHVILNAALKQAVKWKKLKTNPAEGVEIPKKQRREMSALDEDQARRLLEAAKEDSMGVIFILALVTGMRPEEFCALRWSDLDLNRCVARVRQVLCWRRGKGGGWYFDEPKTDRSRRTVSLPGFLVGMLFEHKQKQIAAQPSFQHLDLVFRKTAGDPLHLANLASRNFKALLRKAGLPEEIRLYDLRHSCATLLLASGTHAKVVADRLGHSSITLTMDVYSHVLPSLEAAVADKFDKLLGPQVEPPLNGTDPSE